MPSVLFTSNHCYLDFASGAAVAIRDLFTSLVKRGWEARAISGSVLDTQGKTLEQMMASYKSPVQSRRCQNQFGNYCVHQLTDNGVGALIYESSSWSTPVALEQGYPLVQLLDDQLAQWRPDIIVHFGGGWLGRAMLATARRHGVPAVFWLRNTEYQSRDLFSWVCGAIVPSRFSAEYYKKKLNVDCQVIPSLVLPEKVTCAQRQPRFLTYVAPMPNKGVFYFARIASEIGRLRPDIPMLVITGRGNPGWFDKTGLNVRQLPNLKIVPAVSDPREYYRVSRVIVAPVLWEETFLRTAVEAMFNGIPLLASRRGGVADTLGPCGFTFEIPPCYTPATRLVPSVREVKPWIDVIQRLYDDPQFEAEQRQKCLASAARFAPERIVDAHERYLQHVISLRLGKTPSTRSLVSDLEFLQRFFKEPMNLERFGVVETPVALRFDSAHQSRRG